jgi:DNA ligase 1
VLHPIIDRREEEMDQLRAFQPMLAQSYRRFAPGFAQPKLDGIRCIANADALYSRNGRPIPGAPHIIAELACLFAAHPSIILDGELYHHDLRDDFGAIISLALTTNSRRQRAARSAQTLQYHVYDMPSRDEPFSQRYVELFERTKGLNCIVPVATHRVADQSCFDQLHAAWIEEGYEGSMWRADAPYKQRRSSALLKRKDRQDREYRCLGIEPGSGSWQGLAKRVLCQMDDGRTFRAGVKASKSRALQLLSEKHHVVTVESQGHSRSGIPRFPVVTKFWGGTRTL